MKPRKIPKILSQIVWRSYRIAKRVWHLQKSNYTEGQYIKFKQTFLLLRIRRGTFDLIAWVCILTLLRKYRLLKRSIRLSVPISVKNLKCHKMSAFIENANSCLNAQYFAFGFMSFLGRVERIFPIPLSKTVLPRIKLGAMTLFGGYVDFGCSNKWNKRWNLLKSQYQKTSLHQFKQNTWSNETAVPWLGMNFSEFAVDSRNKQRQFKNRLKSHTRSEETGDKFCRLTFESCSFSHFSGPASFWTHFRHHFFRHEPSLDEIQQNAVRMKSKQMINVEHSVWKFVEFHGFFLSRRLNEPAQSIYIIVTDFPLKFSPSR